MDVIPRRTSTTWPSRRIEHAVRNAMAVDEFDDDLCSTSGRRRDGSPPEVITLAKEGSDVVIHAMAMRPKYRRLLPGE